MVLEEGAVYVLNDVRLALFLFVMILSPPPVLELKYFGTAKEFKHETNFGVNETPNKLEIKMLQSIGDKERPTILHFSLGLLGYKF